MISISDCGTPKQKTQFEEVAECLHGGIPAFIPPFPGSVARYLSPESAFHRRHGEIIPFVATRKGRPVGRIAAIVNRSHNSLYNDKTGFFGFFECEDNPETARLLLEKASTILRERGFSSVRGPYNPSINDECGLVTEGFEHSPYIGLTWNPACYEKLVTDNGFTAVCQSFGLQLPLHRLEPPPRLIRIVAREARRSSLKLRPIKLDQLKEELKIVHEVYNDTLKRNWGFVPITMEDLLFAAEEKRSIADPGMILIAEQAGENAGVALSLPNFNEILALPKKTPRWLRPLHVFWLMKTRRISSARQVVYGVSPRFRGRGLHGWLLYEQFVCAKARYANAELGWIEDSNTEILDNSIMLDANQHRTWKIFEKALA
jgi:hypothetical protein